MPALPRLSQVEYNAIRRHNDHLRDAALDRIATIRSIPSKDRPPYLEGELSYWIHCEKALDWATKVASQRLEVVLNVRD